MRIPNFQVRVPTADCIIPRSARLIAPIKFYRCRCCSFHPWFRLSALHLNFFSLINVPKVVVVLDSIAALSVPNAALHPSRNNTAQHNVQASSGACGHRRECAQGRLQEKIVAVRTASGEVRGVTRFHLEVCRICLRCPHCIEREFRVRQGQRFHVRPVQGGEEKRGI